MSGDDEAPRARRRRSPWVVLGVAVLAYVFGVMHRTSLGVVGLQAADRFETNPGMLALFAFSQVGGDAAAQVPAGLLVDRWGARAMLVVSSALLGVGQLVLATLPSLPPAIAARVLVGMGDAIVFVAVIALVPRWFPSGRVPI